MCFQRCLVALAFMVAVANSSRADIYRWDNGAVISGTEGIEPGPGVQLDHRKLWHAALAQLDLTGANFELSNLTSAHLRESTLTNANLSGANLTSASLGSSKLTNANLSGANLTSADLYNTTLTDANLTGALVRGAGFGSTTSRGFTQSQLQSTASYQAKDLRGVNLAHNNLSGWDFSGQNLTGLFLSKNVFWPASNLTNANLSGANLTSAELFQTTLTNANLSGANLTFAFLNTSTLTNANLSGANLKNTWLSEVFDLSTATFDTATVYNQWTVFPDEFDPAAAGLTLRPSAIGDLDADEALDVDDIDVLTIEFIGDGRFLPLLPDKAYDLNADGNFDLADLDTWVHDLKHTWYGDANLDGEFNSGDLIQALSAGKYDAVEYLRGFIIPAGWASGDWNADGEFNSADLVVALADGGYEQGPRPVVVPEPTAIPLLLFSLAVCSLWRARRAVPAIVALTTALMATQLTRADIYRWDKGEVIPGTEEIVLGPETELSSWNTDAQNLRYGDFSGSVWESRDLTDSQFSGSWLDGARFINTNLTDANFAHSSLTRGLFYGQIGNDFGGSDLTNVNLAGANLSYAYLRLSTLTNADLTGAVVTGADLNNTDLALAQLYSTQNYQAKDLSRIGLSGNNLSGADFSGQNLSDANLWSATLTNANLTAAVVIRTNFGDVAPQQGLTKEQLYSTQSCQLKNLSGIGLNGNDLSGWNFRGQNLTNADLNSSTLTNADLTGANLSNAVLAASRLNNAQFASNTVYNQWTLFPPDFDPVAKGLTRITSPQGDFDANDKFDEIDIDWLQLKILGGSGLAVPYRLREDMFDLDADGRATQRDVTVWVKDIKHTYLGDANVDGEFNSTDLVLVFQAGRYEVPTQRSRSNFIDPATWSTGDWDSDGEFTSSDLVVAFQDGGYEAGPRAVVTPVPEPTGIMMLMVGWCGFLRPRSV